LHTIWHWFCVDNENLADCWEVTPFMRALLDRHGGAVVRMRT
jgi:hypothetical protein